MAREHRRVRCLETGKVYSGFTAAAKALGLKATSIRACCIGNLYTTGGLHWKYASESRKHIDKLYTVYDNKTDLPVIVDGTADEAAKVMGIKRASFFSAVSRCRSGERCTRWYIEVRKVTEEDER